MLMMTSGLLEIRMQERVFMGIGNKPFMDIQPSDAAISNRAVNCVLIGRGTLALPRCRSSVWRCELVFIICPVPADIKLLCSAGSSHGLEDGPPGGRPKSLGSGSSSSSSSSSGIGSLSPVGYLSKTKAGSGGGGGYVSSPGALEEDDLDQGGVVHNLLCEFAPKSLKAKFCFTSIQALIFLLGLVAVDSSESSGESVSGFSSSSHSYHSAVGGEAEDVGSVCSSTATVKEALGVCDAEGSAGRLGTSEEPLPSVPPEPKPQDPPCDKVQQRNLKNTSLSGHVSNFP